METIQTTGVRLGERIELHRRWLEKVAGGVRLNLSGATLAGVIYAFLNLNEGIVTRLVGFEEWATKNNPFFEGPYSDLLGMLPLLLITVVPFSLLLLLPGDPAIAILGGGAGIPPVPSVERSE